MYDVLKSLHLLWMDLARNQRYSPYVQDEDINSFERRATNEGLSYLTLELPKLGKALDRFHATHVWIPPEGFNTREVEVYQDRYARAKVFGAINIPVFLGLAVEQALSGDPIAVDCVRQLSYLFYKLEVQHEDSVESEFIDRFCKTDSDLGLLRPGQEALRPLIRRMKGIIGRVLCNTNPRDITPSHGSGATACRTPNKDKYHKLRYYQKLDDVFPYSEYFFYNATHLSDELHRLEEAPVLEPKARMCLVPKDSRGPRVISCEPAEMMYIQQGLMRLLYKTLENHPLTAGQINFTDQTINQRLAQASSLDNALATIDLTDASDRVSFELIQLVFPEDWVEALSACRSEYTVLPDGREVKLNKFAPMGSACCFPVEALVFWACAQAMLQIHYGRSSYSVFVYGDDIITPSHFAEDVIRGLESIGLLANRDKCFVDSPFRESCGGDYYLGVDVTPVRLRKFFGLSGTKLNTGADFLNSYLKKFGYADSSRVIRFVEHLIGYVYPRTELALPGTIRIPASASNDVFFRRRWNNSLQRFEHRVLRTTFKNEECRSPDWGELLRKELSRGLVQSQDPYKHPLAIMDAHLDPGWYTDPHSVRNKWVYTWLG